MLFLFSQKLFFTHKKLSIYQYKNLTNQRFSIIKYDKIYEERFFLC